jgi:hypothetical protein
MLVITRTPFIILYRVRDGLINSLGITNGVCSKWQDKLRD